MKDSEVIMKSVVEYRDKYAVIACFSNEKDKKGNPVKRYFADIVDRNCVGNDIDAYMVLINPGSCKEDIKPSKKVEWQEYYKEYADYHMALAVSDPAQKCIMAFMEYAHISKIRLINLSDVIDPKLNQAISKMSVEESIFSPNRDAFYKKITAQKAPFIVAWGKGKGENKKLIDLKKQAMERLAGEKKVGINDDEKKLYAYAYIKPWKIDSQKEVIAKLVDKWKERNG